MLLLPPGLANHRPCLPCLGPVGVLLELRGVGPSSPPLPSRLSLAPGKLLEGIWN